MFERLKKLLGAGKVDTAVLVREVVCRRMAQSVLFEPENAQVLKAYVEYGHSFSPANFPLFLQKADKDLVKVYLSMGFELSDKEKKAVLDLKDEELSLLMVGSGSWCPFPYGAHTRHSVVDYDDYELEMAMEPELAIGATA